MHTYTFMNMEIECIHSVADIARLGGFLGVSRTYFYCNVSTRVHNAHKFSRNLTLLFIRSRIIEFKVYGTSESLVIIYNH